MERWNRQETGIDIGKSSVFGAAKHRWMTGSYVTFIALVTAVHCYGSTYHDTSTDTKSINKPLLGHHNRWSAARTDTLFGASIDNNQSNNWQDKRKLLIVNGPEKNVKPGFH